MGRIGGSKHHDVTDVKRRVREILRSGGEASIMAWLIRTVAVSVARHPEVAAMNTRRCKQIVFDDVDIAVPMERIVDGDKVPIMTLIRKAESKSVETVAEELREAATRPIAGSADYTPAERKNRRMERVFFYMPGALRRVVMGEVAVRDTMNLTIVFDHDVIDGAPAARFADTLVKLMESAEGL